jgi:hypothetical protein
MDQSPSNVVPTSQQNAPEKQAAADVTPSTVSQPVASKGSNKLDRWQSRIAATASPSNSGPSKVDQSSKVQESSKADSKDSVSKSLKIDNFEKDPAGDGSHHTTRVEQADGGPLTPRLVKAAANAPQLVPSSTPKGGNRPTFGSPYQALEDAGNGWWVNALRDTYCLSLSLIIFFRAIKQRVLCKIVRSTRHGVHRSL